MSALLPGVDLSYTIRTEVVPATPADGMKTGTLWCSGDSTNRSDAGGLWIGFNGPTGATRSWVPVGSKVVAIDTNNDSVVPVAIFYHVLRSGTPAAGIGSAIAFGVQTGATPTPANTKTAGSIVCTVSDVTGAAEISNVKINILVDGAVTNAITLQKPSATAKTGMLLLVNDGGVLSQKEVSVGADDSGGTGFAVLRVPN